jgi:ABC-type polysaccharide/polyol phosphate transport system ATPase subunit
MALCARVLRDLLLVGFVLAVLKADFHDTALEKVFGYHDKTQSQIVLSYLRGFVFF